MLGGFLSAVNQTIVASALPTIGRDLGDFQNLSWVIIAYLLSSTVVAPLYGKLSDIHGRRAMMLAAIGLFIAGSVLSAVATNMAMLIIGRTLQGIGGGGIVPMVQTTVADMITPRERGNYQAFMGTAWIAAGVVGPALGGIIADRLHWSVIFWLNVPLGLLTAFIVSGSMKRLPRHDRTHKLDILGATLMIAAAVALLLALTSGGTRVPWISPAIFGLVALAMALTVGVRLVAQPGARAVPAAAHARQSGDAARHRGDVLRARRHDRVHDLHAALLSGGAWAHRHAGWALRSFR